jgi:hypothetical protein
MFKQIIKWISWVVIVVYGLINIDLWVQQLTPVFWGRYFSKVGIYYGLYSIIGGWLLFIVVAMIILHITHILKIEKKVFWILLFFFLSNLLLMYLEIKSKSE